MSSSVELTEVKVGGVLTGTTAGGHEDAEPMELVPTTPKEEGEEQTTIAKKPSSSIAGASFNFVNSIIGAGIIGLPFALKEAGLGFGVLLLVVVAVATYFSVTMLVSLGVRTRHAHYDILVEYVFGKLGMYTVIAAMFLFAFGAMIAYLVIIGDTMGLVLALTVGADENRGTKSVIMLVAGLAFVMPLSLMKHMAKLSKTSALSLAAVAWIVTLVVVKALAGVGDAPKPDEAQRELLVVNSNFFPAIGVLAFAFVCQHNCFFVFNSLKDKTAARWRKTAKISIAWSMAACLVLSLAGYLTFRDITQGNLLNNYAHDDVFMNITRTLYALTMVLTYPMEMFVARRCLHQLIYRQGNAEMTNCQHYTISLVLFTLSLGIGLATDDLGIILELTGGLSGTYLGFIMPALLYLRLADYRIAFWKNEGRVWSTLKDMAGPLGLLCFGVLALVVGTGQTITNAVADAQIE